MTDQQQKALRLLGLARRARLLEIGEEPVGIACRSGKAKLLLVAKDAGDHTFRRARSFVSGSKCPYICAPYTKDELGDGLGCNACALCALSRGGEPGVACAQQAGLSCGFRSCHSHVRCRE